MSRYYKNKFLYPTPLTLILILLSYPFLARSAAAVLPDAPSATLTGAENEPGSSAASNDTDSASTTTAQNTPQSLGGWVERGLADQKDIYSAPLKPHNLKWDALFLLATGGLIAADRHITGTISKKDTTVSDDISNVGTYSTVAATGLLFLSSYWTGDLHARETGILGGEAAANTAVVLAITQLIAGRQRPFEGNGHGNFWKNNALGSSFPSGHSGFTWTLASVISHEYPKPWLEGLLYGTATAVSITRVTALQHFPADVEVGGVFGYFIGRHIVNKHGSFPGANRLKAFLGIPPGSQKPGSQKEDWPYSSSTTPMNASTGNGIGRCGGNCVTRGQ